MLRVTDNSSLPQTVNTIATVKVAWVVVPTVTLSLSEIDESQTATVAITITWQASIPPPYRVALYSASSADCSSAPFYLETQPGVVGTGTTFSISPASDSPSSSFYCAQVTDSAGHFGKTSFGAEFLVNPTLTASFSKNAPNIDSGQSITLQVNPKQGTRPYHYRWYLGGCTESKPTGSPLAGVTGNSSFSTGNLTTVRPMMINVINYSVVVTDSSTGDPPDSVCANAAVSVNPGLVAEVTAAHSQIDAGQSDLLTATAEGGTPTKEASGTSSYSYQWNNGGSCKASIPDANQPTYDANTKKSSSGNMTYSALVKDFPSGTAQQSCHSVTITVNRALRAQLGLSLLAMDSGQAATITANVTLSGGAPPYKVTLVSGASTACWVDIIPVAVAFESNPRSGVGESGASFTFSAPARSTEYCARVTDALAFPIYATSSLANANATEFRVYPVPTASIASNETIDSGQSVELHAITHGTGVPPHTYYWSTGSTCSDPIPNQNRLSDTLNETPTSTTTYSVMIADSSSEVSPCAVATVRVVIGQFVSTLALSPSVMDVGQPVKVTAKVTWVGGNASFSVTLYSGNSSTCSLDATVVNTTTVSVGRSVSVPLSPPAFTTYYCADVTDSSSVMAAPYPVPLTVNPALEAPTILANASSISPGMSFTLVTNSSFGGGTPPYICAWVQLAPDTLTLERMPYPFSCSPGSLPSRPMKSMSNGAFTFELEVNDSVHATVFSPPTAVISGNLSPTVLMLKCAPSSVKVNHATNCKATVSALGSFTKTPVSIIWQSDSGATTASCILSRNRTFVVCSHKFTLTTAGSASEPLSVITARYGGDLLNRPSNWNTSITVTRSVTATIVHCSPSSVTAGSPTTITCRATVKGGYSPKGVVSWTQSGKGSVNFTSTTCILSSSSICSVELTGLQPGSVTVTATYGGDSNNDGGSSPVGEGRLLIERA